jgi:prepilin-type processing-associated H-X9-DG protein
MAQCQYNNWPPFGGAIPLQGGSLWAYDLLDDSSASFGPYFAGIAAPFWTEYNISPNAFGISSVPQIQPNWQSTCDPTRASTGHTGACNVLMMDGSCRNVSASVSGVTWMNALTPAGGENIGSDW